MKSPAARIAAIICFAFALFAAPATAHAADPFYGMFTNDLDTPPAWQEPSLNAQAATGVGLLREHVYWDRIERAPGVFDFSGLDVLVSRAAVRGMTLLPILTGTPQFYSTRPVGLSSDGWPPVDPAKMFRFTYELAKRYGTLGTYWGCLVPGGIACQRPYTPIRAWQVWNEPDFPSWWRTGPSASGYTRLLQYGYLGLKLGDVNSEVVIGGLSLGALLPGGFLEQVYDNGGALYFDTLAIHPYAANVGTVLTHIRRARQIATARNDGNVPLRISEYGFATGGTTGWSTTAPCQAALIAATTRELSGRRVELGLKSIILLQWQDRLGLPSQWPNFTGLVNPDGTAKPALAAFTGAVRSQPPIAGQSVAEVCAPQHQG